MGTRSYGRRSVETSNEDKVLFPAAGGEEAITKGEMIDYYERVSDRILPHLRERPLTLQRFPDGIGAKGFYQKQASDYFPDWIPTVRVDVRERGEEQEMVVCDRKATLAYLANQACVTLHPWLSRHDRPDAPDTLVIDLDPSGDDFEAVRRAARWVRELLEELELPCWPNLTGSRGVHVRVPLDRSADFDAVRDFARRAMELLARRHPEELTIEQRKSKRRGRLYLDVGRNAYAQTAVAPWSLRARPGAPVAVPLAWKDLERKGLGPTDYTLRNVLRRTARREDPWRGMRRRTRGLRAAQEALERIADR